MTGGLTETGGEKHRCWAAVCRVEGGYAGLAASAFGLAASTLPCTSEGEARSALLAALEIPALRRWFGPTEWVGHEAGLTPHLAAAREALCATGPNRQRALDLLQLDLRPHPAFTARVLEAVRAIGRGRTCTYGEVAATIGVRGGARAVGQVMARNPLAPVVPCHRVLGGGNRIGGFAGGPEAKARMLRDEGLLVDRDRVLPIDSFQS